MNSLGSGAERLILEQLLRGRPHAHIATNARGEVQLVQGDLSWFGLEDLQPGMKLEERIVALQELSPKDGFDLLPRIELVAGRSTDIHLLPNAGGMSIFLLDRTDDAAREFRVQEHGNQLSLLLRAMGTAVFERDARGQLHSIGLSPPWMRHLLREGESVIERFSFVENFIVDAEEVWSSGGTRVIWSGQWTEEDQRGHEWVLEAGATHLDDGRQLLVIQTADKRNEESRHILQEARMRNLDFDRLRRETDKKEVLLHCIVHDLKGPLSSMVGSMSLIKSRELSPERARELLELGLEQARFQEGMIRGILDAFSVEIDSLEHFESELGRAPDLVLCIRQAIAAYRPAFEQSSVALESASDPQLPQQISVVGEASRLVRVLCNLLENALRNTPPGGAVQVLVQERPKAYRVMVIDTGRGVRAEEQAGLFDRLSQGTSSRGAAGLGLYFCRSTLEMWGGTIGYEAAQSGGAAFWFQLPEAF